MAVRDRFDFQRAKPYEGDQFLALLREEVWERNARLEHPFVKLLFDGQLTRPQLAGWARQDFALKRCPTWWVGGRLLNSPSLDVQRAVFGALLDELGDEDQEGHTEMYLRFSRALGMTDDDMFGAGLLPSTVMAVDQLMAINRNRPVYESLASGSVAGEAVNVQFSTRFIEANDRVYKLPRESLDWFYEHTVADEGHAGIGETVVMRLARSVDAQNRVVDAIIRSKAAYWVFFEGIYAAYVSGEVENYPHYTPGSQLPLYYPFVD